jgi:hypothetical protein
LAEDLTSIHCYADYTVIYFSFKTNNNAYSADPFHIIQNLISKACTWMLLNKLQMNDNKTEFVIIVLQHGLPKYLNTLIA